MRSRLALILAVAAVQGAFASGGLAATASARARWPIIGCDQLSQTYENHYAWKHAPTGFCETGGSLGTLEGIDHAHWKHWGARRATARGVLVDGLGFEYAAAITAYDLTVTHHFLGSNEYAAWYNKLHVTSAGGVRGGAKRGPFNLTIDVAPQE